MAKGTHKNEAILVLLMVVNLAMLAQPSMADDDYNSPIWDGWVDEDRGPMLRPCLDIMKSAKCQEELYHYYFNERKEELDLSCCFFVKAMGEGCAQAFAFWFSFPGLEIYEPKPGKAYNNCAARLAALPPMSF